MRHVKNIAIAFADAFTKSRKFKIMVVGLIIWAAGFIPGVNLTVMDVGMVLGILATYILGQGFADSGKEAVRLEMEYRDEEIRKAQEALKDVEEMEASLADRVGRAN